MHVTSVPPLAITRMARGYCVTSHFVALERQVFHTETVAAARRGGNDQQRASPARMSSRRASRCARLTPPASGWIWKPLGLGADAMWWTARVPCRRRLGPRISDKLDRSRAHHSPARHGMGQVAGGFCCVACDGPRADLPGAAARLPARESVLGAAARGGDGGLEGRSWCDCVCEERDHGDA